MNGNTESHKVSFVMPVYNTDATILKKCVDSIICQTSSCWNLLIIDDGSKQQIADFCDSFLSDTRIQVFHKNNEGVSVARNYGTNLVTDSYIMYVDSDDVLADFVVEEALTILDYTKADIVYGGVCKTHSQDEFYRYSKLRSSEFNNALYDKDEILLAMFGDNSQALTHIQQLGQIIRAPFARIIKTELARQVRFPEDFKLGEDIIWNSKLLNQCSTIAVANSIWYGYVQYPSSAINKYYGNRAEVAEKWIEIIKEDNRLFFLNHPENEGSILAAEYYAIVCYDLLPSTILGSIWNKNRVAKQIISRQPWIVLREYKYRKRLTTTQKLLLLFGKLGFGALAVTIYVRMKSIFKQS